MGWGWEVNHFFFLNHKVARPGHSYFYTHKERERERTAVLTRKPEIISISKSHKIGPHA